MTINRIPLEERFWKYVHKTDTCWLWTGASRAEFGYGLINMGGKNGKIERAHRVSWMIHHGEIPKDMCICHHCDNPLCVRPDHLFMGTRTDNNHDMQAKGRCAHMTCPSGEKHWGAKLTVEKVKSIRAEYATGTMSLHKLGNQYGVSYMTIWHVVKYHNWTNTV